MTTHVECYYGDNGALVVNASGADWSEIGGGLESMPSGSASDQIMAALGSWAQKVQPNRIGGMLQRDKFVTPGNKFEQMRLAREALDDDAVGGAADLTEALAVSEMSISCRDEDQRNVWNQIATDLDLDSRLREAWLALFTDSQVITSAWWGRKTYQVKGLSPSGVPRRKEFEITVPTGLTHIDSLKVVPVGTLAFNREHLAYIADDDEAREFDAIFGINQLPDPTRPPPYTPLLFAPTSTETNDSGLPIEPQLVKRLIRGRYQPAESERAELAKLGINVENLFLMNNAFTWRHCATRLQQDRFARVRLKSVFPLLDQKELLRQSDRAHLLGAANFIVLITQGSDKNPAMPAELEALKAGARNLASVPVLIGDHRLSVEIVTPSTDHTLDQDKYDTIDARITARALGTFVTTGKDQDDPLKLGRVIGTALEGRRKMLGRSYEKNLFRVVADTNPNFKERAKIAWHPRAIALSFDSALATFMLDLREGREISRESILSQFGLDQADEAAHLQREEEQFDDIFRTFVPHGVNPAQNEVDPDDPDDDGLSPRQRQRQQGRRRGGNRNGGGRAPGTGQGQEPIDPRRSRTRKETMRSELTRLERPELIQIAGDLDQPVPRRHRLRAGQLVDAIIAQLCQDDDDPEVDQP